MKVYEAVANAYVKEGATTVFGLLDVRISRNVDAITYRRLHYGEDA